MKRFSQMSLKNKLVASFLAVIIGVSVAIAFITRWILVSSLNQELETRGRAIAMSIAERSGAYLLEHDHDGLLSLAFDEAYLGARQDLVAYIFIIGPAGEVVCHTLAKPLPGDLLTAITGRGDDTVVLDVAFEGEEVYDVAAPIREGIYRIGSVHVGLHKSHIDNLVGKLRITFLGFLTLIAVIVSVISARFSRSITRPLSRLTRISDEMSRGNFDISMASEGLPGIKGSIECPALENSEHPCALFEDEAKAPTHPACRNCFLTAERRGDEIIQLAQSFRNLILSIRLYRKKLRESEKKYRSLFDSGPDPIFVADYDTFEILDANPRAQELYGYSREELLGRKFQELGPEFNSSFNTFFEEEGSIRDECMYVPKAIHYKKGGKPFFVNVHACPISYRGSMAVIISIADITEMMDKDAQLIQASKMKSLGEMSAGIAHEVNQPLNAIKMGSEFLHMLSEQEMDVPEDHYREVVREISVQVDRAAEIIQTLRDFGRKADPVKSRIDPNEPVHAVMTLVRKQLELEDITLEMEVGQGLPPILAQSNRLQQVLFNLVGNARDALAEADAPPGGGGKVIKVSTHVSHGRVHYTVSDNGPGIPRKVRESIFEPFFTTKEAGKGMGLGLAITYGIVQDYGGDIAIHCPEKGGTVFDVHFPAVP